MYATAYAPASLAAARIAGISESVKPGITGAIKTRTGTPASGRLLIAASRYCGLLARGSSSGRVRGPESSR